MATPKKTPFIHQTDLFHPHADPDDHWDLATVFSLAGSGHIDLLAVLIDHPPSPRHGDPAICAVAQMNHVTGLSVPAAVGSPIPAAEYLENSDDVKTSDSEGIHAVIRLLRDSPDRVAISIAGSCRDVAIAGGLEPGLFEEKCLGIYVNAGTSGDGNYDGRQEYNVTLDPSAYALIWDIPCPIYWLPCFESVGPEKTGQFTAGTYSSWYSFKHGDILDDLSPEVQRFFLYMYDQSADYRWLSYLHRSTDERLRSHFAPLERSMWCTAGFLHAAGLAASRAGTVAAGSELPDEVFTFSPIRLDCSPSSKVSWERCADGRLNILEVKDTVAYPIAMGRALKSLLLNL